MIYNSMFVVVYSFGRVYLKINLVILIMSISRGPISM